MRSAQTLLVASPIVGLSRLKVPYNLLKELALLVAARADSRPTLLHLIA